MLASSHGLHNPVEGQLNGTGHFNHHINLLGCPEYFGRLNGNSLTCKDGIIQRWAVGSARGYINTSRGIRARGLFRRAVIDCSGAHAWRVTLNLVDQTDRHFASAEDAHLDRIPSRLAFLQF